MTRFLSEVAVALLVCQAVGKLSHFSVCCIAGELVCQSADRFVGPWICRLFLLVLVGLSVRGIVGPLVNLSVGLWIGHGFVFIRSPRTTSIIRTPASRPYYILIPLSDLLASAYANLRCLHPLHLLF